MNAIIGTMRWGAWGEKLSTSEYITLIETALEHDMNCFDSADIYGGYTTEAELGKALKESQIERSAIQLISKCGICYPSEYSHYNIKYYDTSAEHIMASVTQSLKDLQTDYLDYLLIHRPNPLMNFEEMAETIEKLKSEGKIRHFGLSNFTSYDWEQVSKYTDLATHQISYSLTDYSPLFDGRMTQAQTMKFPLMAWSPLGSFYSGKISEELKISVMAFAQKYECSENLILLSWVCHHPAEVVPVIGTTKPERIAELSRLPELRLEDEDWFLLLEKSRGKKVD